MQILSQILRTEIVAVDIGNLRYDIFGKNEGNQRYEQRLYLIYSGIHYDLCVKNFQQTGE